MTTATEPTPYTGPIGVRQSDPAAAGDAPDYRENGGGSRGRPQQGERLARGLGWFSIGLGLAELLAPERVARLVGLQDPDGQRTLVRTFGLREIANGVCILSQPEAPGWMWARVAGDAMDLALLGSAIRSDHGNRRRATVATAAVLGVAALDVLAGQRLGRGNGGSHSNGGRETRAAQGLRVKKVITVYRPVEEIYRFWRNFENLPRFMDHLESVRVTGDRRSRWKAKAPAGATVEWDAEITEDRPNELIAWQSLPGADVANAGRVRFRAAPGGEGTEVDVELRYDPPGGRLGWAIAKLFGEEPEQQVHGDLRRFKQVLEIGEVMRSDASIHQGMHPAQPSAEPVSPPAAVREDLS